jgi:DNA-binding SARP family transcriptional activator
VQYRLLGPLEVLDGDRVVAIGGGQRQSLLALLLIHANEVLSTDRLIDELWGSTPPATAAKSLQVKISTLRKALGQAGQGPGVGPLVTRGNGYALRVSPDDVDSLRFGRLVEEGQRTLAAGESQHARQLLREALALWRGPPLTGLEYERFAQPEIARLEELRLDALEARAEAGLALGEHTQLIGELESLVREHPLRERYCAQLMVALYRSGRQADALSAYRATREVLSEELGLEPGEELRRVERAILRQDPGLDLAESASPRAGQAPGSASVPEVRSPMAERALLVVPSGPEAVAPLLAVAEPMAKSPPARELIIAVVVEPDELREATAALATHRNALLEHGVAGRTAAFSSPTPGDDLVRLASEGGVDLLLGETGHDPLESSSRVVLENAPCDVVLLVGSGGSLREGPVIVPFGAAWHDWAALEVGAWIARSTDSALRLIGAASGGKGDGGRDASRLLADASIIVQRKAGVLAEPLLGTPGRAGVMALAQGAGMLVVGFPDGWRADGLGRVRSELVTAPPAPTLLVRRGDRSAGLAPAQSRTRFGWSRTQKAG